MDRKLVAWAHMVKTRSRRGGASAPHPVPTLWLFTDRGLTDPVGPIRALAASARGLSGVVLRGVEDVAAARALACLCRRAGIPLVVAGDVRLACALRAGLHLSSGRRSVLRPPRRRLISASAHDRAELRRAVRNGAHIVFISPVFPTSSHPGGRALGSHRAARLARTATSPTRVFGLGGINGATARALPARLTGAGAISALRT